MKIYLNWICYHLILLIYIINMNNIFSGWKKLFELDLIIFDAINVNEISGLFVMKI